MVTSFVQYWQSVLALRSPSGSTHHRGREGPARAAGDSARSRSRAGRGSARPGAEAEAEAERLAAAIKLRAAQRKCGRWHRATAARARVRSSRSLCAAPTRVRLPEAAAYMYCPERWHRLNQLRRWAHRRHRTGRCTPSDRCPRTTVSALPKVTAPLADSLALRRAGRGSTTLLDTPVRRARRPLGASPPASPAVEAPASPAALPPLRVLRPLEPRPKTSGTDERRRSSLARLEYMCSICHDVLTAPVITRCGHRFDHHCLARWMHQARGSAAQMGSGCPLCKAHLGIEPPQVDEELRVAIYAALPDAMSRAQKHRPLAVMRGHRARLRCMLLSPPQAAAVADASTLDADAPLPLTLYTGGEDGDIRIWSLPDGKCIAVLEGHTSWINCLSLADGDMLVSGAGDATARVWNVASGQRPHCRHVLQGHEGWILSMAIHESLLVTAGKDTDVRVWDVRSGKCLAVLRNAPAKGNLTVGIVPPEHVGVRRLPPRPARQPGPIEDTGWTLCIDRSGDSFFQKTDGSDERSCETPLEVLALEAREILLQTDATMTGIVYCGGLGKKLQLWECPVPKKTASICSTRCSLEHRSVLFLLDFFSVLTADWNSGSLEQLAAQLPLSSRREGAKARGRCWRLNRCDRLVSRGSASRVPCGKRVTGTVAGRCWPLASRMA